MAQSKVIVKKYENRRLYDSTNSRYVNLEEIAEMVRQGVEVQAIDAATGDDITRLILTQIIMEGAKDRDSGFPLDVLRQMVVATGRAGQETLLRNTRALFDMYQNAYGAFTPAISPMNFMQMMMKGAMPPEAHPAAKEEAPPPTAEADAEVNELRRRIEELEQMVARVAPQPRPRKSPQKKSSPRRPRK